MKISLECDCVLLQKSLLLFCKDYISSRAECDFIVSDKKLQVSKPLFLIAPDSPHISVPFSKAQLMGVLEDFYSAIQLKTPSVRTSVPSSNLEEQISALIDNFKSELIALIRSERG